MTFQALPATDNPEMALLLCSARVQMDAPQAAKLESLLTGALDRERVLRLAEAHKVLPLLFQHLNGVRPDLVPEPIAVELKNQARLSPAATWCERAS